MNWCDYARLEKCAGAFELFVPIFLRSRLLCVGLTDATLCYNEIGMWTSLGKCTGAQWRC